MFIYVAGQSRSGTTIISRSLSEEIGAVFLGEVRNRQWLEATSGVCGCSSPLNSCLFWREVPYNRSDFVSLFNTRAKRSVLRFKMAVLGQRFSRRILRQRPSISGASDAHMRTVRKASEDFCRNHVVDSSKVPEVLHVLQAAANGSHAPACVFVVRGLRAFVATQRRRTGHNLASICISWLTFNILTAISLCRNRTSPSVCVSYEEFCDAPSSVVRRIVVSLGIKVDSGQVVDHSVGGTDSSLYQSSDIVFDERWRFELTTLEQYLLGALGNISERIIHQILRRTNCHV